MNFINKYIKKGRKWTCVFGWHYFKWDLTSRAYDCCEPNCKAWDWF